MSIKIEKKITHYAVQKPEAPAKPAAPTQAAASVVAKPAQAGSNVHPIRLKSETFPDNVVRMHEKVERPDMLIGTTFKVKTPVSDHAMYVTINDIVLNEGTPYEQRRPFEIFINSKNLDHYQWVVALTRVISAVFRKGGDMVFLVEELKAVFDPKGGYWKPGGKFMPSLIAEIGDIIERHLVSIGLMENPGLDEHQKKLIAQKRAEFEAAAKQTDAFVQPTGGESNGGFPAGAVLCGKCNTVAVVRLDGCDCCLQCGNSKCS